MKQLRWCMTSLCMLLCALLFVTESRATMTDPLTTIKIDTPIHFIAPDGSPMMVPSDTYTVEAAEEWLRLVPGERHDAVLIEAKKGTHELELTDALALSVAGAEADSQDLHHVILLLPNGESLEATGSYSGIRPRGLFDQAVNNVKKKAKNAHKKAKSTTKKAVTKGKSTTQQATTHAQKKTQQATSQGKKRAQNVQKQVRKGTQQAASQAKKSTKKIQNHVRKKTKQAVSSANQGLQHSRKAALQAKREVEKTTKKVAKRVRQGVNKAKDAVGGLLAPPPTGIQVPNFPFFNLFQPNPEPNPSRNPEDHSFVNAYLLAFTSWFVYEPDLVPCPFPKDCWPEWQRAFRDLFGKGGMSRFQFIKEPLTNTQVSVMSNNQVVVVVFRGSEKNLQDWLQTDANFPLIPAPQWGAGVMVHNGFNGAMRAVVTRVRSAIQAQNPGGSKRVWLTGHSLGGALAFLHAQALTRETSIQIQGVHTYGAPRVGNPLWNRAYQSRLGNKTQRWNNNADFVPLLVHPVGTQTQQTLSYQHVGLIHNIRANGSIRLNDRERSFPVQSYSTGDHHLLGYICPMVS
ncbi:MAG: hypothetical protein OET79_02155, partial [Nitrospirota bacterium]|nr:hypothetical protein [Nitrospirota bacterium]